MSSRIPGFYKLSMQQRRELLNDALGLEKGEALEALIAETDPELLDGFVENAVGGFSLPLGIAVNFMVDGREVLIPMAVEESSVVAAASNMARLVRATGGFQTEVVEDLMIGQIQVVGVDDPDAGAAAANGRSLARRRRARLRSRRR